MSIYSKDKRPWKCVMRKKAITSDCLVVVGIPQFFSVGIPIYSPKDLIAHPY